MFHLRTSNSLQMPSVQGQDVWLRQSETGTVHTWYSKKLGESSGQLLSVHAGSVGQPPSAAQASASCVT